MSQDTLPNRQHCEPRLVRNSTGLPEATDSGEGIERPLRPILMTLFAFALGLLPLQRAIGGGTEMRVALGVAVF